MRSETHKTQRQAWRAQTLNVHSNSQHSRGLFVVRCPNAWDVLEPSLKANAERLADLAKRGLLVLFLGSGISAGAGMPVWTTLLNLLAKRSGMLHLCL